MELDAGMYFAATSRATAALVDLLADVPPDPDDDGIAPDGVVPADILRAMARLRLLEGAPFSYLVADAELLPAESIRFFYLDRNATDALVQGALSVGTVNSADRVELAQLYQVVRDEIDQAERLVRLSDADAAAPGRPIGAAGPITGFLLRSRAVSGWPGLHVRAYSTDTVPDGSDDPGIDTSPARIRLLRMERLAPAVLLVLFDGVPAVVHIEEPRSGIQFGVRYDDATPTTAKGAFITPRDVTNPNAGPLKDAHGQPVVTSVPFRPGSTGVINMTELDARLQALTSTKMGADVNSAEYAIQMLRFPLRQVFGDTSNDPGDSFTATVDMSALADRFRAVSAVLENPS